MVGVGDEPEGRGIVEGTMRPPDHGGVGDDSDNPPIYTTGCVIWVTNQGDDKKIVGISDVIGLGNLDGDSVAEIGAIEHIIGHVERIV